MVIILAPYHQDTEKIARIKLPQVPQVTPNYGIHLKDGETWVIRVTCMSSLDISDTVGRWNKNWKHGIKSQNFSFVAL